MRNGKYGCAVWGCGWVSSGHINAYLRNPSCEVVALGSRSPESVASKRREFGLGEEQCRTAATFQELLDDDRVDIISICTPNSQHAEEAILAARAGKHIFLEKPIAIEESDIPRLVSAVEESGVRSIVGLILRFSPLVQMQRRLVQDGELGRVFLANVDYWFGRERKGWMKHRAQTGGAFLLGGCHSVDMVRYVLDSDIVRVSAQSVRVGDYYEYPPVETAQVQFANGALGVFSCSLVGTNPYTANMSILGEKGTIMNDRFYLKRFQGQKSFFRVDTGEGSTGDIYDHPFPAMVDHFVECIREGRESPHNIRSAINAHLACLAVRKSAENDGAPIYL